MKIVIYGLVLLYSIIDIWINPKRITDVSINQVVVFMLITLIILLIKEKFLNHILSSLVAYLLILFLIIYQPYLSGLLGIIVFDVMYKKFYRYLYIFIFIPFYFIVNYEYYYLTFILGFVGLLGYILNLKQTQHQHFIVSLDNERRIRYELEHTKRQLLQHSREIERLTEIKERNRIARDIHDHIGHDIAGVLVQLQAAEKVFHKDTNKSMGIISLCVNKLSKSLEIIRNTVYNIKPNQEINENLFKKIINHFIFCPIEFNINGNINECSPEVLEVLLTNLKESLTNASKYSSATQIDIQLEINTNFIRYSYKDNGVGCKNLKDGLGISGMKNRITNLGGMIHFDGNNGFSIISIIPRQTTNIFKE